MVSNINQSSNEEKMKKDLFVNLPTEIIIDVLSRLPIPTIIKCKRVCKSWLDLVKSQDFAISHLSKSARSLVSQQLFAKEQCKVFEFVDELNHPTHCCFNFKFNFHHSELIVHSSVDDLLFLRNRHGGRRLYICNPITREYIELPNPRKLPSYSSTFGFGVSKIARQYKLVRVAVAFAYPKCEVYTLGTGCWRSIPADTLLYYTSNETGTFVNGNLHWLPSAFDSEEGISSFDLDTELFTTFSLPLGLPHHYYYYRSLTALGDRLCLCDYANIGGGEIVIWLMKEYGDEKSWTKKFVIKKPFQVKAFTIKVVKVFEDGDILIATGYGSQLLCFSTKANTIRIINFPRWNADARTSIVVYTPSFLPMTKIFVKEIVSSF